MTASDNIKVVAHIQSLLMQAQGLAHHHGYVFNDEIKLAIHASQAELNRLNGVYPESDAA